MLERIDRCVEKVFAPLGSVLEANLERSRAARLPEISVSAAQGKLLYVFAKLSGARRALEIGTVGGFSTTWIARALPAGGEVVTLERDPGHADVARRNLQDAAPGVAIDLRVGRLRPIRASNRSSSRFSATKLTASRSR